MRLKLVTRITLSILGVLFLAVASSTVALVGTWQIGRLLDSTALNFLPSVRSTEELEIEFLEQRGCVSSYILDGGNPVWIELLRQHKSAFDNWLLKSQNTSNAPEEDDIVARLRQVHQQYELKRDEVVSTFDRGDVEQAKTLLFGDVNSLYNQVYEQCEQYIDANQRHVDQAISEKQRRIQTITEIVGACVILTVISGSLLFWLFWRRVLKPLRAIIVEAQSRGVSVKLTPSTMADEFRIVGHHLRSLMVDVTDARSSLAKSQKQLIDADKLASVGRLAASVAHEIRNPLTSMKMWLYSIRKAVAADFQLNHKFDVVTTEIDRLESIVRTFLEFSRPAETSLKSMKMSELIDKTLELFGHRVAERNIELLREEQSDLPNILADADQFKQLLLNLLDNAVQAIDSAAGRVIISTSVESDENDLRMVVVRVIDSGGGVAPQIASRIFEPFVTSKTNGTGLGLCIAAGIMAHHRGRLVLESTSNHGTTFAAWFPLIAETAP